MAREDTVLFRVHDVKMTIELWADAKISADLPRLVLGGESETLEFKRELPKQVRDLAKEIAAFASTQGGRLLIGVADDGSILGVPNADDPAVRDDFGKRIVGVCQIIDPPVRPQIDWASSNGAGVLVLTVEKGSEPLYYVESRAYIRHDTVSRPANPAEVRSAVSGYSAEGAEEQGANHPELSTLAEVLANVQRWSDTDSDMRNLNPWAREWAHDAEFYASRLRDLSITTWAINNRTDAQLEAMSERLDDVAQFQHFLGGGDSFDDVCRAAGAAASELMRDLVDTVNVSEKTQNQVIEEMIKLARKLTRMWDRAGKDIFDGRVEKAQEETYGIGKKIATWTYFRLSLVPENTLSDLRRIGLGLLQLAAIQVYMDGGASLQQIVNSAQDMVRDLNAKMAGFPKIDD